MFVLEIGILLLLMTVNGLLALSELAVVSARRGRLTAMADAGYRGAQAAKTLAENPGRFLSTVQVGITLVGVLSGAFSGATLGERLGGLLAAWGVPPLYAAALGVFLVVMVVTYLSVIIGELVPKQMALRDPERWAAAIAPIMLAASRLASPLVTFFDFSGRLMLRLLRVAPRPDSRVTDEEIRVLIAEAETAGVIEPEERSMLAGVMRLADRNVQGIMTPRSEVDMVDLAARPSEIRRTIRNSEHSRLPAYRGSRDEIVGVIQAKDLVNACLDGEEVDPREHVRSAPVIPDTIGALDALAALKRSTVHMALVHDEYGHFLGIVTTADIREAITGVMQPEEGSAEARKVQRADGSWLLAGDLAADEVADLLNIKLPRDRDYHTLAGFLLAEFGRIPEVGEDIAVQGWRLEVVDLDGRRIDKVLAQRLVRSRRAASSP